MDAPRQAVAAPASPSQVESTARPESAGQYSLQAAAFPTSDAFARIESELGQPLTISYAEIDAEPIASASLGQVYRARLDTGEEVAVKVQRPALTETISIDVAILYRLVRLTNRFFPKANENADWEGMLHEFYSTIFEELDYVKEGRNADRFRYNFRTWRAVRVPKVFWTHTTTRVLTLEFIRGTKVVDVEGLRARRISAVKVNRLLVRTYLKQLLEDGFFHADPHPGNLMIDLDTGVIQFLDLGMVGEMELQQRISLGDLLFEAGKHKEAIASYSKVRELDPSDADALVSIGLVYNSQDRSDDAIRAYHEALDLEPENIFALNALGDALYGMGDAQAADRSAYDLIAPPWLAHKHHVMGNLTTQVELGKCFQQPDQVLARLERADV